MEKMKKVIDAVVEKPLEAVEKGTEKAWGFVDKIARK